MFLEDPLTATQTTQPIPKETRQQILHRIRLPHLMAFKSFKPTRVYEDEDPDASFKEKFVSRGAKWSKTALMQLPYVLCALLVLAAILIPVRYLLGYNQLTPIIVTDTTRSMYPAASTLAYKWLDDRPDAYVAEHVVKARAGKKNALLVLVGSKANDAVPIADVKCASMFSSNSSLQSYYSELIDLAETFLSKATDTNCVCAPQLGYAVRYIAFRTTVLLEESAAGSEASAGDAGIKAIHLFNPTEANADLYDALDAAQMFANGIGLTETRENQNYRYNMGRGNFTLLRRTKLSITGVDRACQRQRVGLTSERAVAAEECLDLLRGIDVRERARMQFRLGVKLNLQSFVDANAPVEQSQKLDSTEL